MILRILLGLLLLWAVFRFTRSLAAFLLARTSSSKPKVQPSRRKRRNRVEGGTVIDVEYTESRSPGEDER